MDWSPIAKPRGALRREPCLTDYEQARRDFTWEKASCWLSGLPGGALNMAFEAVDRHAAGTEGLRDAGAPVFDPFPPIQSTRGSDDPVEIVRSPLLGEHTDHCTHLFSLAHHVEASHACPAAARAQH